MFKDLNKKESKMLIVSIVLTVIGVINSITAIFEKGINIINVLTLIDYLLLIVYAGFLYKKPHGNLLKYLMIVCAFTYGIFTATNNSGNLILAAAHVIVIIGIAYISGRLDRFKQNIIIASVVLAVLVGLAVFDSVELLNRDNNAFINSNGTPAEMMEGMPPVEMISGEMPEGEAPEMEMPPEGELPNSGSGVLNTISTILHLFNMVILWLAVSSGYGARYKQHKEAGILDK